MPAQPSPAEHPPTRSTNAAQVTSPGGSPRGPAEPRVPPTCSQLHAAAAGQTNGGLASPERASLKDGDALWELSGLSGPCLPGAHRVGDRVPLGCAKLSLIPGSWEHPSCEVAFIMSQPCLPLTPPWSVCHLPRIGAGGEGGGPN